MRNTKQKKTLGHLWKPIVAYAIWKLFVASTYLHPDLDYARIWVNHHWGSILAEISLQIAKLFGETGAQRWGYIVYLKDAPPILFEDHCLAFPATFIFAVLVFFFPAPRKEKFFFLLFGVFAVQTINLGRLASLMFMQKYASGAFFAFNHSYTYLFTTYTLIFLLFVWWTKKQSKRRISPDLK
jgi:exosortase/archaeosortase family protein